MQLYQNQNFKATFRNFDNHIKDFESIGCEAWGDVSLLQSPDFQVITTHSVTCKGIKGLSFNVYLNVKKNLKVTSTSLEMLKIVNWVITEICIVVLGITFTSVSIQRDD